MLESVQPVPSLSHLQAPIAPPPIAPQPSPIRYRVLQGLERYDEVLALRREAFGVGHLAVTLADPRDRQASLIAALSGTRIIATLRLTPPLPGPLFHPATRFRGRVHELPARSECLESSRACIHPDFRGQGLFWQLAAEMVCTARDLGKPYLVGGADQNLLSFWTRCGFEAAGVTYGYPGGSIEKYRVVVLEVTRVLAGRGIAPELEQALAARE